MRQKMFRFLELLLVSVIYWIFAFRFLFLLRYNGLEHELKTYTDQALDLPITDYYQFAIIIGLIIGVIYAISEYVFDSVLNQRFAIIVVLLIKSLIYFVFIIATLSWVSTLVEDTIDIDLQNEIGWWHTDPVFWTVILYFVVASLVFSVLRIAKEKFGGTTFLKILIGKYRKPKEEARILMFLDLKDSTSIAEKLGHTRYSRFIQDCFIDLNNVLRKYNAEVYQYVGDEAVISWTYTKGFKNNMCINLFYGFKKRLESKRLHYNQTYEFFPEFRAGLHFGKLMVAEVGTIKKELAYHGDVINTAARIQKLCARFNEELLISKSILEHIKISDSHYKLLSEAIELKGKEERLDIYTLRMD